MANQVVKSIIVKAAVSTVYETWANFENFPHFMENIKSVRKMGDRMSHWEMDGPVGTTIEWDAETTVLEPNKRIAWSSKDSDDSDITTSGQAIFTALPAEQTEISVTLQYVPKKGGIIGSAVAKVFTNPEEQLEEDLRNFKKFVEGRHDQIG